MQTFGSGDSTPPASPPANQAALSSNQTNTQTNLTNTAPVAPANPVAIDVGGKTIVAPDFSHLTDAAKEAIADLKKENKKLQDEIDSITESEYEDFAKKVGASLTSNMSPAEKKKTLLTATTSRIDENNKAINQLHVFSASSNLEAMKLNVNLLGEQARGMFSVEAQKFSSRATAATAFQQNAISFLNEEIKNENVTFQGKLKGLLAARDEIISGKTRDDVDRGVYFLQDASFKYLQALGIDQKIHLDQKDKALRVGVGTVAVVQSLTDYNSLSADKVLLFERNTPAGKEPSPSDPIALFWIPTYQKINQIQTASLGAVSASEADGLQMVHNIPNAAKVYAEGSNYYIKKEDGSKQYVPEDEVYSKRINVGTATIADLKNTPPRKTITVETITDDLDANGNRIKIKIPVLEPLKEAAPTEELTSLYFKVKPAKVVNYHTLPPTQQKDFDVTFAGIKDPDRRKLISGIWSKVFDSMGLIGALLRTFLPKLSGLFGGKHKQQDGAVAPTQVVARTLGPDAGKVKLALADGKIDGKDKNSLIGVDIHGSLVQLANSYITGGGTQDLSSTGQLEELGKNLISDINNAKVTDANPHDYTTNLELKPVVEVLSK